MVANLRIIGGETVNEALGRLEKIADDPNIKFSIIHGTDPSRISKSDGSSWEKLNESLTQTWPDAIATQFLMFAASDSRHYCRISDHVYRFSAMALSKEERASIHANNERVSLDTLAEVVQFYTRLMLKL
jgi:carboxypeptidase PM20D1